MTRVLIESPFAGPTPADIETNVAYTRAAVMDCLKRGEAPYASHLFFTQPGVLDDTNPKERQQGIDAGLLWGEAAEKTVVYVDRGMSNGMKYGLARARELGRPVEFRSLVFDRFRLEVFNAADVAGLPYKEVRWLGLRNGLAYGNSSAMEIDALPAAVDYAIAALINHVSIDNQELA